MINLITPPERRHFARAMMEMHHDRKRVFVDALGWQLRAPGSWLEVDEFDSEHAIYLVAIGQTGGHEASVRLLPSSRPHMMSEVFADLCPQGVMRSDRVWEISRLVTSPDLPRGTSVFAVHRRIAMALMEFAVLNDITRYVLVTEARRVPALLSVGWQVDPLSLPVDYHGCEIQALAIHADEQTLIEMRARYGVAAPVLVTAEETLRRAS
jgi:acyl-homoserine lactone synthase